DVTPTGGSTGTGLSGTVTVDMCGEGGNYITISYDSYFTQAHQLTHARIDFTGVNVDIDSFMAFCCDAPSPEVTDVQKTSEDRVLEVDFSGFAPGESICINLDLDFHSSGTGTPYGSTYAGATVELTFTGLSGQCSMPLTSSFAETDVWTAEAAFSCDGVSPPPPDAPSNLIVTVFSSSQIDLSWQDNSDNEDGFRIERMTDNSGSFEVIHTTSAGQTTYSDMDVGPNITYTYRITAFNSAGNSATSNQASGSPPSDNLPDPPSNLQVHILSDQFHLTWEDNSDDEQGFILEHFPIQIFPGSWLTLATLDANMTSYQLDNPALNVTHHFRVTAFNENGNSDYSNEVDALFLYSLLWIAIDAPNGGEVWSPGSIQEITWRNSTILKPVQVNVWYSTDGGSNWIEPPIAANYNNTGSCPWTIPDTPSENCILKIADASDGSPYDLSHDPFTIGESTDPILSVSPLTLDFGTAATSMTFQIFNSGAGSLNWSVAENPDVSWITSVSPQSGTGSATITVQVDRNQMSGDSEVGMIAVTSNGGDQDVSILIEKETVELPEDWLVTDNTGNNAIVILPTNANPNIDSVPLMQGDYISVFTAAGLCCGWTEWNVQNASITVWGDDSQTSGTDGFQAGETVAYRVYRPSDETEWTFVSVAYSQGNGQYAADAIMILSQFDVSEFSSITLDFNQGWNLFSMNVEPADSDVETVMAPVLSDLTIVKNGFGQTYIPDYDINHIGELDFKQGYKGYFSQTVSLEVTGIPVDPSTSIALSSGWSMIGYLPVMPMDVETALASIVDPLVIAKDGSGKTYFPDYDINQIGQMQPGLGYQVYLNEAGTLIYPAQSPDLPKLTQIHGRGDQVLMEYFQYVHNTGENATVVITEDIQPGYSDGTPLSERDEIGVFTSEGLCCGAVVWESENTAITVWGDDSQTDAVDGFQPGDTLLFYVYSHSADCEYLTSVLFQEGNLPTYQVDGIYVLTELTANISTQVIIGEMGTIPTKFELRQNHPNPFNPSTSLQFDVPEACFVLLTIYDLLGRKIETLIQEQKNPGVYSIEWHAKDIPSGLYLVRLEAGHFIRIRKMVLNK
ncbi:fibronectin type III domain-containing protein, partial [bacterium]